MLALEGNDPVDSNLGCLFDKPLQPVVVLGGSEGDVNLVLLFGDRLRGLYFEQTDALLICCDNAVIKSSFPISSLQGVAGLEAEYSQGMSRLVLVESPDATGEFRLVKEIQEYCFLSLSTN